MSAPFGAPALAAVLAALLCLAIFTAAALRTGIPPHRRPQPVDHFGTDVFVATVATVQARWRRRRTARTIISAGAVAAWCDALARSLRAGTTLRSALINIEPADIALAQRSQAVRQALGRGATVSTAVTNLHADQSSRPRPQSSHLALATAVLSASGSIGGPTAASLDRLAGALRLRVADGQERSAHSAQARLSAHVLTFVPLGLLALLVATDSDVRAVLSQPTGFAVVAIGLALNLAGWWWMRCIVETGA
jgi:Flp pilus assembly protein TadB